MRPIKLNTPTDADELQESLQVLKNIQNDYKPVLPLELLNYLDEQARFVVSIARQYRHTQANWADLLKAGHRALVEAWREKDSSKHSLPFVAGSKVREAILTMATNQLVAILDNRPHDWARAAGESDEIATAFASYYADEVTNYERDMASETAQIMIKLDTIPDKSAQLQRELEVVREDIKKIPAVVLGWAWQYLGHYKAALHKGHSQEWANTYARHCITSEEEAEEEAYEKMREKHSSEELLNQTVYQQAYIARLDRGEDYADAYARQVGSGEYHTADKYAEAFVKQHRVGKSSLFADYYASEIASDTLPKYAELEAEIYEQALAQGMEDKYAYLYADRLATKLIEYAVTDVDKAYYTQETADCIAKMQQTSS